MEITDWQLNQPMNSHAVIIITLITFYPYDYGRCDHYQKLLDDFMHCTAVTA